MLRERDLSFGGPDFSDVQHHMLWWALLHDDTPRLHAAQSVRHPHTRKQAIPTCPCSTLAPTRQPWKISLLPPWPLSQSQRWRCETSWSTAYTCCPQAVPGKFWFPDSLCT